MQQYDNSQKISEIKTDMRVSFMNQLENTLRTQYEIVGKVSANELAIVMGTYEDEDGCPYDTTVVIKVSAKPFYSKEPVLKPDGTRSREIKFYDARSQIENYEKGVEE